MQLRASGAILFRSPGGSKVRINMLVISIVCLGALCGPVSAVPFKLEGLHVFHPNGALPKHVVATAGKLSVFADFKDIRDKFMVVYLVNGTDKPIHLPAQDGDIYLKMEVKDAKGKWQRAQAHAYSTCGNSYISITVPAKSYVRTLGSYPNQGKQRAIRYKLYNRYQTAFFSANKKSKAGIDVISNVGQGGVPKDAIERAKYDSMAIGNYCDQKTLFDLASGKIKPLQGPVLGSSRSRAISSLARFNDAKTITFLEKMLADDDVKPHYRTQAFDTLIRLYLESRAASKLKQPKQPASKHAPANFTGDWKYVYHNGRLQQVIAYRKGVLHGPNKRYYITGHPLEVGTYKDGKTHGLWKSWHPNRVLKSQRTFKKGDLHGVSKSWDRWGTVTEQHHTDGQITHSKTWDSAGKIVTDGTYKDGKPWSGRFIETKQYRVVIYESGKLIGLAK
jgi:hypothetical protein